MFSLCSNSIYCRYAPIRYEINPVLAIYLPLWGRHRNQRAALYIISACRVYHHAFACISSTIGCISHSPPPLRGAPCDSLFKTLTFLSLALACTLSTNENKFSSVNVSRREPQFRFPCRGGACSSRNVGCVPFNAGRRGRRYSGRRGAVPYKHRHFP